MRDAKNRRPVGGVRGPQSRSCCLRHHPGDHRRAGLVWGLGCLPSGGSSPRCADSDHLQRRFDRRGLPVPGVRRSVRQVDDGLALRVALLALHLRRGRRLHRLPLRQGQLQLHPLELRGFHHREPFGGLADRHRLHCVRRKQLPRPHLPQLQDVHVPVEGVDGLQPRLLQEDAHGVRLLHPPRRRRPARPRRLRLRQGRGGPAVQPHRHRVLERPLPDHLLQDSDGVRRLPGPPRRLHPVAGHPEAFRQQRRERLEPQDLPVRRVVCAPLQHLRSGAGSSSDEHHRDHPAQRARRLRRPSRHLCARTRPVPHVSRRNVHHHARDDRPGPLRQKQLPGQGRRPPRRRAQDGGCRGRRRRPHGLKRERGIFADET